MLRKWILTSLVAALVGFSALLFRPAEGGGVREKALKKGKAKVGRLMPASPRLSQARDAAWRTENGLKRWRPEFPPEEFLSYMSPVVSAGEAAHREKQRGAVPFLKIPEHSEVVSLRCGVTSSEPEPFVGSLDLVTDGENMGSYGYFVELSPNPQWVQIDLGSAHAVDGVWIWHNFQMPLWYNDVVVGVSATEHFQNPTILFNNDFDNTLGFGSGTNLVYEETNHGKAVQGRGALGRYVRLYTNGRDIDEMNHYTEVLVLGRKNP